MIVPGLADATEAIPEMTMKVGRRASRVDLNRVFFAHVLGKFVFGVEFDWFKFRLKFRLKFKHHPSFGNLATTWLFAVIHLQSVFVSVLECLSVM